MLRKFNKMHILIFSQYYWPESFRINDVSKTLLEKDFIVEILTGKPNYPQGNIFPGYGGWGVQRETVQGININRIPILARGNGSLRLALNYLSFIMSGLLFAPWMLRKKRFDIIFVYAPSPILQAIPAIFLGWIKGCPVVLWVQDLWPESLSATGHVRNRYVIAAVRQIVRFIYRHVDLLLVQSKAFIDPVRKLASSTPIIYFPNSVDATFANIAKSESPNLPGLGRGFSVMFAGNVGTAQAVEVIVETASLLQKYSNIHFVVLGEGSRWQWMREEKDKRELKNLHICGKFPIEAMPGLMNKASALLVTLADQPIFAATIPSKIQAYLSVGKPILACMNGEGARIVSEAQAGIAVPAEDSVALASAVLELYNMPSQDHKRMGENGRQYYKNHFDHNQLVDDLVSHFEKISLSFRKI